MIQSMLRETCQTLLCAVLLGVAACQPPAGDRAAAALTSNERRLAEDIFSRPSAASESTAEVGAQTALQVQFYIWTFQLGPLNDRQWKRLWNHIDENAVGADTALALARNGLRVGIGKGSSWPAVRSMLNQHEPEVTSRSAVAQHGLPLIVELDALEPEASLFYFDAVGHLNGARFAGGTKQFHLEHAIDLEGVERVFCRVVPELRKGSTREWTAGPWSAERELQRFEDLAFELPIGIDEHLIIGPSPRSYNLNLVGSRFVRETGGSGREILFCIVPRIVRRELTPGQSGQRESQEGHS